MPSPYKHPKTGVYWLRDRAPADVAVAARGQTAFIEIAGKSSSHRIGSELKVSLGTKDPSEARLRGAQVTVQFDAIWEGLRHPPRKLTQREIAALSGELYAVLVTAYQDNPGEPERWSALAAIAKAPIGTALRIGEPPPRHGAPTEVFAPVARVLALNGLTNVDEESIRRLTEAALTQQGKGAERLAANANGDWSPDDYAKRFPIIDFNASRGTPPAPVMSLTRLVENWAKKKSAPDERTVKRYTGIVKSFVAYLGHDDALRVTDDDIVRWHSDLLDAGTVTHDTFIKAYRAALSTIYAYGMSPAGKKVVAHNPASKLALDGPKRVVGRSKSFTVPEAHRILQAAQDAPKASDRIAPHHRLAMRWVPWLAAYSGARPGELCQLRKQDFILDDGVKCVALLPDAGTIKTGAFRHVPLHPDLIAQGIWEMVQNADDGPLFYDKSLTSARPWENTTAYLSEWVRRVVKITDDRISPSHAWRHWFKTKGRTAGIPEVYLDVICGHAPATEGGKYGDYEAPALLREIERLPAIEIRSARGEPDA